MKLKDLIGVMLSNQKAVIVDYHSGFTYDMGTARQISNNLDYDMKLRNSKIFRVETDIISTDAICIYILKD